MNKLNPIVKFLIYISFGGLIGLLISLFFFKELDLTDEVNINPMQSSYNYAVKKASPAV